MRIRRKIAFCLGICFSMIHLASAQTIVERVEALLAEMTLKEKVGQMTQLTLDAISVGEPYNLVEPHQIDSAKLHKAIVEYGVGSILNTGAHANSREHWYEIHRAIYKAAQESRLQIPVLYGIDAIHGNHYTLGATLFPQPLGQAATWNPPLVEQAAAITAYETRAAGIPWNFSPILDVMRQPLWSRVFETFGEDPYLASVLGQSMVKGYQGENVYNPYKVAACMKHYLGYSFPFTGKDRTPAYVPDWMLREIFLPPYQAALAAGAKTIMVSSGEINGIPSHVNAFLLQDLLRDELGFEGLAVSDWEDIMLLHTRHRVAATEKEAIKMAINAGIDMSMVPLSYSFPDLLLELVEEGEVSKERIDEAVGRILTLKIELGLFERPYYPMDRYPKFASAEHSEVARQLALESITLLKNENDLLPLNKQKPVLLTGPAAHSLILLNGAWSRTWQGTDPRFDTPGKLTIKEAFEEERGAENVLYFEGSTVSELTDVEQAVAAASKVETIVVCLGESPSAEKPGDIDDLEIADAQEDLVEELAETGKPIVLVLMQNRPRLIQEMEPKVDAILLAYQPGDEGGIALTKVLYGDHNPEGRLPYTYPRFPHALLTYDYKTTEMVAPTFGLDAINPQYPFGFGLSYTQYEYQELNLDREVLRPGETITVSISVKNTGRRLGREVVQLYVQDLYASVTPPNKRLKGFKKVTLLPNESREVIFQLKPEDLAFWGQEGKFITEPGDFKVMIREREAAFRYETE
jgi:beta-glucosidase